MYTKPCKSDPTPTSLLLVIFSLQSSLVQSQTNLLSIGVRLIILFLLLVSENLGIRLLELSLPQRAKQFF